MRRFRINLRWMFVLMTLLCVLCTAIPPATRAYRKLQLNWQRERLQTEIDEIQHAYDRWNVENALAGPYGVKPPMPPSSFGPKLVEKQRQLKKLDGK
jgi:hypothetical protein